MRRDARRRAGPGGTVTRKPWAGAGPMPNVAAAVVSDEDAVPRDIERLRSAAPWPSRLSKRIGL